MKAVLEKSLKWKRSSQDQNISTNKRLTSFESNGLLQKNKKKKNAPYGFNRKTVSGLTNWIHRHYNNNEPWKYANATKFHGKRKH